MATKEPPDPPADRPFADKVTKDSITVVWPGTTYDGGSIVTGYVVEMQKKGETKWKVLTEDVFSTSYQVNGLKESEIYLFRVCCVNAVGKSKPSLVSEEITPSDSPQEEMDEEDEPDEQAFEPRDVKVKDTNVRDFYQIKEELGRGKFGTVNKCVEKKTKRILAAKFIKVTSQTDREEVDNEVSIMQILQHPKLLQLYDAFASGDNYVLILEFVSGGELFERVVAEDFQLTEKEVVFFMRQICEGVVFMHLKNILHLDMKPENILCVRPKSNKIKIIDFGLARKYNPKETLKVMFGTPEFTAPEVINYDKITKATDMWSVGVICYVLLSGLSPFMGDNDGETMSNVTSAEWDFEDESFDEISDASKEFIENLLVLDPTERLSAAECLEHDWIKKDVASSHKISKARIRRFLARRKWQKAIRRTRQFLRKGKIPPVPYPSILPSFPPALVTDTDTDNGEILGRRRESESELSSSYLPHRRFSEPTGSDSDSYFTAPETEDAPKFLKRIEKQDAVEGQPVKFECVVSGNPKPTVIWLRNNFPIREGDDFKFLQEGERFILHMSAVYPEDAGLYTAKAINAAGYLNCSAELHVEEAMTDEEYRTPVELLTTGESTESETETLRVQIEQDSDATDTEDTAPEFTKKMKSAEVVEGDLVRFDCKVTGTPMPDITWCKDGHVLSIYGGHHRFFTDDNGVCAMVIPQTTLHDNGEYTCSAANFVGKVSCSASLLVKEKVELPPEPSPPDFTSTFKDLTIVEGSMISLQCTVSGYPEPDVMWILNGRVIQPATDIRMMFDGETASFTRVKALPEDSGVYTCRLTNMHGETHSCNARVTVVEESRPPTYKPSPPKFLQSFTDVVVVEGNEVKFECTIVGTPTPEVMWYYQRKPIKETSDFKFIQDGLKYTLHIVEAFPEDEGEYTCKACNSADETSWSAELFVDEQSSKSTSSRKVRSKGFPPSFIHELQDVTVFEGSAVTLECKVTGLPEPSLSWNCNGQEVESDDNRKLQFLPDGTTSVVFSSATKSDEGEYTCIAESSTGKSTSTALLTVLPAEAKEKSEQLESSSEIGQEKSTTGIPLPPERPPEITDVTATNLVASWPACLQDAAASPVTYIVELRELPADEWFCVGVGIPDTELLVENLLPSTEYEFQVRAENVFGVSEPSQVSQVIVTLPIDDASKRDLYKQRRASSAEGLPYFIGTPEEVYVQPNQTARLQCSVRADPVLEVCWIHDGQIIPNDGRYQHSVSSTGVCSLKIEEVKTEDVGEYECVATNDIGTSRIALFLDLAEPPKFLTELEDQTVKAGQPLRLECRIGGIPEPDIFWYKDDMFVEETSNIQVIFEGEDICGLAFAQITMDDTGEYMIKAKNIAGECSNSCIIMVEDPSSEDDTKTRKIRFKRKEKVENYYEVREELGRGAFGVVKRVITKKNGEDAAAKFIHAKPQMRRELKQEMQIMAQLDHMRLIKLLDAFETKRELIMVMELVTGGELFDKIVTEDCLTESEAVYFLRQVLEGLQHMHERLIVHLDLKPENILLVKPNDDNIKLIDFGLARKLQPGKDVFVKFGTPEFVAPEVVEKHPISTASDLWSLGVIAYVMLSGISPFMGDDDKQTLVHVKNGQWNFNDVVFNTVTEEAKDFISKLLILNPNNRMTTQECLDHPWLELADNRGEGAKLSTEKLKSFNARRKWQKALTAVKSAMRIRRLSTISSDSLSDLGRVSPGSTSAASDTEKSRATKSESSEDIQAEEGEISIKIPQLPLSRKKSSEEEKTQKDIEGIQRLNMPMIAPPGIMKELLREDMYKNIGHATDRHAWCSCSPIDKGLALAEVESDSDMTVEKSERVSYPAKRKIPTCARRSVKRGTASRNHIELDREAEYDASESDCDVGMETIDNDRKVATLTTMSDSGHSGVVTVTSTSTVNSVTYETSVPSQTRAVNGEDTEEVMTFIGCYSEITSEIENEAVPPTVAEQECSKAMDFSPAEESVLRQAFKKIRKKVYLAEPAEQKELRVRHGGDAKEASEVDHSKSVNCMKRLDSMGDSISLSNNNIPDKKSVPPKAGKGSSIGLRRSLSDLETVTEDIHLEESEAKTANSGEQTKTVNLGGQPAILKLNVPKQRRVGVSFNLENENAEGTESDTNSRPKMLSLAETMMKLHMKKDLQQLISQPQKRNSDFGFFGGLKRSSSVGSVNDKRSIEEMERDLEIMLSQTVNYEELRIPVSVRLRFNSTFRIIVGALFGIFIAIILDIFVNL